MQKKRILGIDPGLANTGFGIVDFENNKSYMISYGVIETPKTLPKPERLKIIYDKLNQVISEFYPNEASMENLYFAKNVTSALDVSQARGVISLCLVQAKIPLYEYSPKTIKNAVTGTATADKKLVEQYVALLLNLNETPSPDHAADALAAAITHINSF